MCDALLKCVAHSSNSLERFSAKTISLRLTLRINDKFRIVSKISEAVSDTSWVAETATLISATIYWRGAGKVFAQNAGL